jgi:TetR/AcrR family acrAB operon transcriptional repressor
MRRTKEQALVTRHRLLDAAERLFATQGVSRTSLHDIATAAGLTRGAIYWHFAGKAELFDAMLTRVTLPLEAAIDGAEAGQADPLEAVRTRFLLALRVTADDARTRRVFDIALHKVEHTGELRALRRRRRQARDAWLAGTERALRRARHEGRVAAAVSPRHAAIGLLALIDGLIANWLLDPRAFGLVEVGTEMLDRTLQGLADLRAEPAGPNRRAARPLQRGTA